MNYELRAVTYTVTYAATYTNYVTYGADQAFRPEPCNFAETRTFFVFAWMGGGEGGLLATYVGPPWVSHNLPPSQSCERGDKSEFAGAGVTHCSKEL